VEDLASILARHPIASGLSEAQRQRLGACGRAAHFDERALVFREHEVADTLYLIDRGRVVLEQHIPGRGCVQVESLGASDILGLSWMFAEGRWSLDARAVEPVDCAALDAACLRRLMAAEPELGLAVANHLLQRLYERLLRVRLQRLDVYRNET
jgi:CRP/FNR family transcriptional regulator, cyclic AMP receptor protein